MSTEQNIEEQELDQEVDLEAIEDKFNPTQEKAYGKGWKPAELYEGEEEDFKTAGEFLRNEKFYGKINSQNKQIQKLEQTLGKLRDGVNKMTTMHLDQVKAQSKTQIEQLRAAKYEAAANNEPVQVEKLNDAIHEAEKELAKEPDLIDNDTQSDTDSQDDFRSYYRNEWAGKEWYDKDEDLRVMANIVIEAYHKHNPQTTPEELFSHVDSKMKRFLEEQTSKKKAKRAVSSRSSGRSTSRNSVSFSAVPEELREAARNAIQMSYDSGKYKTLKEAEQGFLNTFAKTKLSGDT